MGAGGLTKEEKRVAKALLNSGRRNQDIQDLINKGRAATINIARITEVKKDQDQKAASEDEIAFFEQKKRSYDPKTGLNLFDDERLIRAREAMILAVHIFNSSALNFKTEVFSVIANIAWTYLLHEYYERKGVKIIQADGRSLLLSKMIGREDCPLSKGVINNLKAIKIIRDEVEHNLLGKGDVKWLMIFQACCLNFDKAISDLFGAQTSLAKELSFALQFSRMNFAQLEGLNKFEIPENIEAIDARLQKNLSENEQADLEYKFYVAYTMDSASKSRANFEFIFPESAEGKKIHSIMVKQRNLDSLYPNKPTDVCKKVKKQTGCNFTVHNHTQAWKLYDIRPSRGAKQPENTNKKYCTYHALFQSYSYSDDWVDFLVREIGEENKLKLLCSTKLS